MSQVRKCEHCQWFDHMTSAHGYCMRFPLSDTRAVEDKGHPQKRRPEWTCDMFKVRK